MSDGVCIRIDSVCVLRHRFIGGVKCCDVRGGLFWFLGIMNCIDSKFSIIILGRLSHWREKSGIEKGLDARSVVLAHETSDKITPVVSISMGPRSFVLSQLCGKIYLRDIRSTICWPQMPWTEMLYIQVITWIFKVCYYSPFLIWCLVIDTWWFNIGKISRIATTRLLSIFIV